MTHPSTLLVVDDTPDELKLLAYTLMAEGYRVFPADTGALALSAVNELPPDLILLDIDMPEMDGFEVCRRLKAAPATCATPVILLGARLDGVTMEKGLALGAEDFLAKPVRSEELLPRVKSRLELQRLRRQCDGHAEELRQLNERLRSWQAEHRRYEQALVEKCNELEAAHAIVKALSDLLPIHPLEGKSAMAAADWIHIEHYLWQHAGAPAPLGPATAQGKTSSAAPHPHAHASSALPHPASL